MERFVALLVPQGFWDGVGRMGLTLTLVASWAFFSHYTVFGAHYPTRLHFLANVLFMALPPSIVFFRILAYLNVLQKRLQALAETDGMTELPNRRAFFDRAMCALEQNGGVFLLLDVDHFKQVNDSHGHEIGDRALVALADLLRLEVRKDDIPARIGGEEFAVLLVGASVEDAREIGERLAEGVQLALPEGQDDLRITTSVGAVSGAAGADIDQLLGHADEMMYAAKRAGRARLFVWEPERASSLSYVRRICRSGACHGTDITGR